MIASHHPLNILCINPWIYDFTAYDLWSKPLGLLYIAAILRERGIHVDCIDCLDKWHPALLERQGIQTPKLRKFGTGHFHRQIVSKPNCLNFVPRYFARYGLPEDIFRDDLRHGATPDAILLTSFMTYWYPGVQRAAEICREIYPDVPLILGGIYATLMPDHAQAHIQPDYLIVGSGEQKILELLANIFNMPKLTQTLPKNFDDYPYPAFDLLHHNDYIVTLTSRGCPFRCSFCATHTLEPSFIQRAPEAVVREILTETERFNVKDVAFYDDALLFNPENHIKPILKEIIKSGKKLRFHTPNGLHGRYIDEELAELMVRAHFKTIRISLESISGDRRSDIDGKINCTQMEIAINNLKTAGFDPNAIDTYIIMGLPDQSLREVAESIRYAHGLGVQIRLTSYSPIPGTRDYGKAVESGYFPDDADPLLTNKTIIPLYRTEKAYQRFQHLRQLTKQLNQHELTPDEFQRNISTPEKKI